MALVYCDGFDSYATAALGSRYTVNGVVSIGSGRFGNALLTQAGNNRYVIKDLPDSATYIAGFAMNFGGGHNGLAVACGFYEVGGVHVDLRVTGGRVFQVTRAGTVLATGTTVLAPGVWYYIEFKVFVHDSTGTVDVKINGVSEIALTGQDTRNGGTGVIGEFYIGTLSTNNNFDPAYDDLVLLDTTGSAPNNTFLGDVRVETLTANGNGNSSQLVGSDGNSTDNYLLIDESTPNSDTDYVQSATVGDKDTYTYSDLTPTTGTIFGVQAVPFARKTDAGTRSIKSVARLSATETDSADAVLMTTYRYFPDMRETKPGGGAWSISDVNSAEFGVKVSA